MEVVVPICAEFQVLEGVGARASSATATVIDVGCRAWRRADKRGGISI
jgi:hypothetical protein